jgi:HIRAN domain-containing protein
MAFKLVSARLARRREKRSALSRFHIVLAKANVDAGWAGDDSWRGWEAPRNVVRGESEYRKTLRRLTGKPRRAGYLIPVEAELVREPANPYDSNALRVDVGGELVGYLAREVAAQIAGAFDRAGCRAMQVCAILRGGSTEAPDVRVHLWLDRRRSRGIPLFETGEMVSWPPSPDEGVHRDVFVCRAWLTEGALESGTVESEAVPGEDAIVIVRLDTGGSRFAIVDRVDPGEEGFDAVLFCHAADLPAGGLREAKP